VPKPPRKLGVKEEREQRRYLFKLSEHLRAEREKLAAQPAPAVTPYPKDDATRD
jgi:hypothetical protein